MKFKTLPHSKGLQITWRRYRFSVALGKYSRKLFDYWASPLHFKKTLSTPLFWACLIKE